MPLDLATCHAALLARDARFDGRFYVGVRSTGIYCRPVCPARTPKLASCDFFVHPAAAERAGFRPCLRCRPELAPGAAAQAAPVDAVARLAEHAAARIDAGVLDAMSLEALAAELGSSSRHLRRAVEASYGVSPQELARTRRLHLAKRLLTDTPLPVPAVAQAAGYGSQRRLHAELSARYGLSPSALRRRQVAGRGADAAASDSFTLRLAYRPPLAWDELRHFLVSHGAAGVEAEIAGRYCRTVKLGAHAGWVAVGPDLGARDPGTAPLKVEASTSLLPVLPELVRRLRHLLDLDADPHAVAAHLGATPRLATAVAAAPGLRVPGAFDAYELALRAVLGQQVTVKAATTLFGRFARAYGEPVATPFPGLTHHTPTAARVAAASHQEVIELGLTSRRAATVLGVSEAIASGRIALVPGSDTAAVVAALDALPGIGPWTAGYIAMRALRDPDAFLAADLAVLKVAGTRDPRVVTAIAEPWRPWRAYAVMHLWREFTGPAPALAAAAAPAAAPVAARAVGKAMPSPTIAANAVNAPRSRRRNALPATPADPSP